MCLGKLLVALVPKASFFERRKSSFFERRLVPKACFVPSENVSREAASTGTKAKHPSSSEEDWYQKLASSYPAKMCLVPKASFLCTRTRLTQRKCVWYQRLASKATQRKRTPILVPKACFESNPAKADADSFWYQRLASKATQRKRTPILVPKAS